MENRGQIESMINPVMLWVIVNDKQMKKVRRIARENHCQIGTFLYGHGSVREKFLQILGLDDVRREMALIINDEAKIYQLFYALDEEFNFAKNNRGIEFILPLTSIMGTMLSEDKVVIGDHKEDDLMYEGIITIVDRGLAKTVMEAAQEAGANGGTIMRGRGTGRQRVQKIFNMEIEPEKEIVLVIARKDQIKEISQAIDNELGLDQPNTGILFTFALLDAKGIS